MSGRVTFLIITCHIYNWQTFIYLYLLPVCLRGDTHVYQLYNFIMLKKEREQCNKACHVHIWISQFKFHFLLKIYDTESPNPYFNLKVKQIMTCFFYQNRPHEIKWQYGFPGHKKGFAGTSAKRLNIYLCRDFPYFQSYIGTTMCGGILSEGLQARCSDVVWIDVKKYNKDSLWPTSMSTKMSAIFTRLWIEQKVSKL